MFYADFLFVKRGPLSKVWQMAHLSKKLSRRDAASTNVITAVQAIEQPAAPLALRSQGQLLLGLVRIYDGQVRYLQADCTEAAAKLDSVMERGRAAAGRRGDVDVDAKDIIASAGAITVSEREAQQGLGLYDGYDALEEQRYLEDHARQLSAYSQDPAAPYPSLSLSLSQSQSQSSPQQQQQQQRLSQAADLSLEQARRATQSFHSALDDFELGEGLALEDDLGLLEGAVAGEAAAGGVEPMELEMARDDEGEMRRESVRDDGADILGLDADRRVSLISAAGAVDETADEQQRAADLELIQRREARRQDRKRLRFASAVRDEVNEIDAEEMKAMIADTADIVRSRESSSLLNPRRRRERLIRGVDGVSSLLQTAMAGSLGEERVDRLLAELFSAEGVRTAERVEGAAEESKEDAAAVGQQDVSYLDAADIVGGDFNVGLQDDADITYEQQQQQPASPRAEPPGSPSSAPASAVPAPPTQSDLLASAQSDRLSSLTTRSFFDEAASASPVPEEEKEAVGFTSRTRKVLSLLRQAYGGRGADRAVQFDSLAQQGGRGGRVGRGVAAGLFYQMLVLAQAGAVRCEQQAAFEEITITRGEAFDDVAGRLGAAARVSARG